MSETVEQVEARLLEVRQALSDCLKAQSYSISGRSLQRANLDALSKMERRLEVKLARMTRGSAFLADHSRSTGSGTDGRF